MPLVFLIVAFILPSEERFKGHIESEAASIAALEKFIIQALPVSQLYLGYAYDNRIYISIYKEESLSVCLFVCSLCIWTPYVPVQPNFPGILFSTRRRSRAIFFPRIISPSPRKQTPLFPTNGIAAFLGIGDLPYRTSRSRRGQVTIGFRGR